MTRIPFATWQPTPTNFSHGGVIRPPNGLVLHIAQGSFQGTQNWERNPAAQVSSYCIVGQLGQIVQEVDLDDKAWTESAGNEQWIGVEFEGFAGTPLTPQQVTAAAKLLAWLHTTYGVPLVATDDVNGHGLGWHGMGGNAWGGHFGCPGAPIVAQRPQIIAEALAFTQAPPEEDMPLNATDLAEVRLIVRQELQLLLGGASTIPPTDTIVKAVKLELGKP